MKLINIITIFFCTSINLYGQSITGCLTDLSNQEIKLEGFNGFTSYTIATTKLNDKGNFKIKYDNSNFGIGHLISSDNKPFILILNDENIEITGKTLTNIETIKIKNSKENQWFEHYAKVHPKREQAISAWVYLEKLYKFDSIFLSKKQQLKAIQQEKNSLYMEDTMFLKSLPKNSYVSWFLPMRKLISSVPIIAQYRSEEINETIKAFRNLDYIDYRLYKSGLLKDAIEGHFWLIENSGKPIEKVYEEMRSSIDIILPKLVSDEKIFNEVTDFLFDLLEKHSLFEASEYLALKVLNEIGCTVDNNLIHHLEIYRAMKKGNIAPDIIFDKTLLKNNIQNIERLSEINADYKIIVFGASWCPNCQSDYSKLKEKYLTYKKSINFEIIYISIDTEITKFTDFFRESPFITYCDGKGWQTKSAIEYHVFATPTILILDKNLKILSKINSINHLESWFQNLN